MKRGIFATAFLLLCACVTKSNVDPNATITIDGSLAHQNGSPVAGRRISLLREADIGEGLAVFTTLGLACLNDTRTLSACSHGKDSQTAAGGEFSFTLKGKDTQGFLGNAATMELVSVLPRTGNEYDGAATVYRFQVQTEHLVIPLRFWEQEVAPVANGDTGRISYSPLPPAVPPADLRLDSFTVEARFERGAGETVWVAPGRSNVAAFDARVLEDSTGTVALVAYTKGQRVNDDLGRAVDEILRTPRMPYRSSATIPKSRGVACSYGSGTTASLTQNPCRLTDGDFAAPADPCAGRSGCTDPQWAQIDIGRPRPAKLIVVRGCTQACRVWISADGRSWTSAGDVGSPMGAIVPSGSPPTRYVRVLTGDVAGLTEVSLWDSELDRGPTTSIIADANGLLPPLRHAIDKTSRSNLALIAIAFAALAIGLLLGFLLRRRAAP